MFSKLDDLRSDFLEKKYFCDQIAWNSFTSFIGYVLFKKVGEGIDNKIHYKII